MRTEKDKIKDIFSSKLADFEPGVPSGMWDKIVDNIPVPASSPPPKSSPIKRIVAISTSIAAAIILLIVFIIPEDKETVNPLSNNLPIDVLNPALTEKTPAKDNLAIKETEKESGTEKSNKRPQLTASANKPASINNVYHITGEKEELEDTTNTENNVENKNEPGVKKTNDKEIEAKINEFTNQGKSLEKNFSKKTEPSKQKGFAISIGGNTSFSDNDKKISIANSLKAVNVFHNEELQSLANIDPILTKELPGDIEHNQPVSFGITVSKNINKKISVETGVVYTYLSSKIKSKENIPVKRNDVQYFHYLGVPISLNYNFASWGKADFYVSGGGMIQKDFHGHYKEYQVHFNKDGQANQVLNKKKIHQSNPQFSALGKVGATYPIYHKMHVYATVGGAYYFDADNRYKTIYSDKEIQLDLNIGIKFKF